MGFPVFGLWCRVVGHKRRADSRRNLNGAMFATCARCACDLYREPVRGTWRPATEQDRQPRGFSLTEPMPVWADKPKKTSHKKRRSSLTIGE